MNLDEMLELDKRVREAIRPARDRRTGKVLETLREAAWRTVQRGPARMRPAALALLDANQEPWERMRRCAELIGP